MRKLHVNLWLHSLYFNILVTSLQGKLASPRGYLNLQEHSQDYLQRGLARYAR